MPPSLTNSHAETIGLQALFWVLGEPERAGRLLALTGLSPDQLRAGAGEPALLASVVTFLEAHEPDLLACAEALEVPAPALVAAREALER